MSFVCALWRAAWMRSRRINTRLGRVPLGAMLEGGAALFDHASMSKIPGDVSGFDAEGWAAMLGMREAKLRRVLAALTEEGVIINGHLIGFGDEARERATAPNVVTLRAGTGMKTPR
jgi:hypothetical protein